MGVESQRRARVPINFDQRSVGEPRPVKPNRLTAGPSARLDGIVDVRIGHMFDLSQS